MAYAARSRWSVPFLLLVGCTPHPAAAPAPQAPRTLLGVIDTVIELPTGRPYGVAASRDIAYITIYDTLISGTQALSIWDFGRRTYRHAAIPTGAVPTNVAFDPAGRSAFVASQKSFRVDRIDVRRSHLDAHWHTPANDPFQVATSPDGRTVYATGNAGWLYGYDARTGESRGAVQVSADPNGAVVSSDGRFVYLTHLSATDVGLVDVTTWQYRVLARMDSAQGQGIVLSPDGKILYTVSQKAGRLYAFDSQNGRRLRSAATGLAPFGLAATPDGRELWVTTLNGEIRRYAVADLAPLPTLTPGGRLRRLAFDPAGREAVIADEHGRVIVIR